MMDAPASSRPLKFTVVSCSRNPQSRSRLLDLQAERLQGRGYRSGWEI